MNISSPTDLCTINVVNNAVRTPECTFSCCLLQSNQISTFEVLKTGTITPMIHRKRVIKIDQGNSSKFGAVNFLM